MIGKIINIDNGLESYVLIPIDDFLNDISISWDLMELPHITLTLPVKYSKHISGTSHIYLSSDKWEYEGYVEEKTIDFRSHTITLNTVHVINKLSKRTLPTNITLKSLSVKDVVAHTLGHWKEEEHIDDIVNKVRIEFVDSYAELYKIEFEFSNETLIEFFTKVCEKTPELYWRVSRFDPYLIQIGVFGKITETLISEHYRLITLDNINEDYSEVTNVAVVMGDKSDGGASTLTLRDIFYNKNLMVAGFPVIKTGNVVNNQRHYQYPQIPQFAPEIIGEEFAVIDEEGVALEAGQFYWGTVTDNDTQAIAHDNEEITNDDRIKATQQLYNSAIRRLRNSRRRISYSMLVEPKGLEGLEVGDKVLFTLSYGVHTLTPCSKYYEKILKLDNWFYITSMEDQYSVGNAYVKSLVLSKFLHSDRDVTATT